jgi:hypothetical protein
MDVGLGRALYSTKLFPAAGRFGRERSGTPKERDA